MVVPLDGFVAQARHLFYRVVNYCVGCILYKIVLEGC